MRKTLCIFLLIFALCLTSCEPYVSSYSAVMMSRSMLNGEASLSFERLEGTYVIKSKVELDGAAEGSITYSATLTAGEINVYYDTYGVKELLFHLSAEDGTAATVADRGGYIERGQQLYIIVETVTPAKGSLAFSY